MVSTHVSFLLNNSMQLRPKKLQGLKFLPEQQLLEHVYARAASVTLLQNSSPATVLHHLSFTL